MPGYWWITIVGRLISAIRIGDVSIPITPKIIPKIPAVYSLCKHAKRPSINAIGLNKGERIKMPMNPNIILRVP